MAGFLAAWLAMADAFPASIYPGEIRRVETMTVIAWAHGKANGGNYPQNLEDIHEADVGPIVRLTDPAYGALGDRYGFPSAELTLPGRGRVMLMGTKPIQWAGVVSPDAGRMVGYIDLKDEPKVIWLPEAQVAALLAGNPAVKLLTLGTKVTPPPYRPSVSIYDLPPDDYLRRVWEKGQASKAAGNSPALSPAVPDPVAPSPSNRAASPPAQPPSAKTSPLKWLALAGAAATFVFACRAVVLRRRVLRALHRK
jgi:hypothetical protein